MLTDDIGDIFDEEDGCEKGDDVLLIIVVVVKGWTPEGPPQLTFSYWPHPQVPAPPTKMSISFRFLPPPLHRCVLSETILSL